MYFRGWDLGIWQAEIREAGIYLRVRGFSGRSNIKHWVPEAGVCLKAWWIERYPGGQSILEEQWLKEVNK